MTKIIFIISVLQTLPFGIGAILLPGKLFSQFGVSLDQAGELIARGYGATLIGFGLVLWGLRNIQSPQVQQCLLIGLILFNAIEAAIQFMGGLSGVAQPIIFGNVGLHAAMAVASLVTLLRTKPKDVGVEVE